MIKGSCHCGNVSVTLKRLPRSVTSCNCSICYRLGAIWGYYNPAKVSIATKSAVVAQYAWGKENIHFFHCPLCSCTTHYETTEKSGNNWVGVNFRMIDSATNESIPIRNFDGAESFRYLDEES